MADRKQQLLKLLEREPNDPFLLYGLAMEHKKSGEFAEALILLSRVIQVDPGYCYAYYQQGQIQTSQGDQAAARATYQLGMSAAQKKGDDHACQEIAGALSELSD